MGSAGSAAARFARAIERRNLPVAFLAAHELGHLTLQDALRLVVLMAERRVHVELHGLADVVECTTVEAAVRNARERPAFRPRHVHAHRNGRSQPDDYS